ncbi:hypothetical protein [Modestobacter sp. SYSU DS0657]
MSDEREVQTQGRADPGAGGRGGATALAADQGSSDPTAAPAVEPASPETPPGATGPVPLGAAPPAPAPAQADPPADQPGAQADPPGPDQPGPATTGEAASAPDDGTPHPTTPVNVRPRPRPRLRRPDPLIRMGPWAPVAGAGIGLVLGLIVVLFLAPAVETFAERLAVVFVVLGLSLLGAGGTLLADEVRLMRRGAWAAEARASGAGVIAGLLNGLTPARLLILASAFVLLLSAYVTSGG